MSDKHKAKKPDNFNWDILDEGRMAEKTFDLNGVFQTHRLYADNEDALLESIKDFEEQHKSEDS